jgi:hypothetical protein
MPGQEIQLFVSKPKKPFHNKKNLREFRLRREARAGTTKRYGTPAAAANLQASATPSRGRKRLSNRPRVLKLMKFSDGDPKTQKCIIAAGQLESSSSEFV